MLENIRIYETSCTDPYTNLAAEKYLLEHVRQGECILYLWQNQNTVVIGRNQNAWAECRVSLLDQEGGKLARRLSGGGAVFHDLGNLNFTFLTTDGDYDLQKQFAVIQTACAALGIHAEPSGRNDLLVDGLKFSGNAFYHSRGRAYHHGTLLVNADMDKLSRYLSPPKAKLQAKGIASVRSRVANLSEFCPGLTCSTLKAAMKEAFSQVYGCPAFPVILDEDALSQIAKEAETMSSWQWLYGKQLPFSFQCEKKFPWGYIQLQLQVEAGVIQQAKVYTDAMDWCLSDRLEAALTGCRFSLSEMDKALYDGAFSGSIASDLLDLLKKQEI